MESSHLAIRKIDFTPECGTIPLPSGPNGTPTLLNFLKIKETRGPNGQPGSSLGAANFKLGSTFRLINLDSLIENIWLVLKKKEDANVFWPIGHKLSGLEAMKSFDFTGRLFQ